MSLKAQFAEANSSDLFSSIMFGSDAKKAVIHDDISLSNQLLVNKRKSLLRFLRKTTERFQRQPPPVPASIPQAHSVPPPTKGLMALGKSSKSKSYARNSKHSVVSTIEDECDDWKVQRTEISFGELSVKDGNATTKSFPRFRTVKKHPTMREQI